MLDLHSKGKKVNRWGKNIKHNIKRLLLGQEEVTVAYTGANFATKLSKIAIEKKKNSSSRVFMNLIGEMLYQIPYWHMHIMWKVGILPSS